MNTNLLCYMCFYLKIELIALSFQRTKFFEISERLK